MSGIDDLPEGVSSHLEDDVLNAQKSSDSEEKDGIAWGVIQSELHNSDANTSETIGEIAQHYYDNYHFLLRKEDSTMFVYSDGEGIYEPKANTFLRKDLTENLQFSHYEDKYKESVMDKIGGKVIESSEDIGNLKTRCAWKTVYWTFQIQTR